MLYVHQCYTQEQLLREAVQTEIQNRKSLENLIRVEEQKKQIMHHKHKFQDEEKVVFRQSCRNGQLSTEMKFQTEISYVNTFRYILAQNNQLPKVLDPILCVNSGKRRGRPPKKNQPSQPG